MIRTPSPMAICTELDCNLTQQATNETKNLFVCFFPHGTFFILVPLLYTARLLGCPA